MTVRTTTHPILPHPAEPATVISEAVSDRQRPKNLWRLYRMAARCDSVTPELAAELRIVSHD